MYLIDTNIFLEVMLRRSRSLECKELLKMLRDGKVKGVVTDFTIYSIMILLGKLRKLDELRNFLLSLTAYKGLYVYSTSISEKVKAVNIASETGLDIDDAIQYAVALSVNAEAIISFDKHFDNLKNPSKRAERHCTLENVKIPLSLLPLKVQPTMWGGGRLSTYP